MPEILPRTLRWRFSLALLYQPYSPFINSPFITSWRPYRPCLLYGGQTRQHTEYPCPYTAPADASRGLPRQTGQPLLIGAGNDNLVGGRALNGDALDLRNSYLMGIPQVHNQVLALLLHTVTNTVDVQVLLKPLRNADHHIVDQVRVRPCRERFSFSSLGRVTRISLPSTAIAIFGWNFCVSVPLGP